MTLHVGTWYVAVGPAGDEHLTLAGWWYAFVSLNLFRFVLFRWYFRLIIWYVFLWRVSRLPLRLNPLHPDRAGGLGFIGNSVFAFTPVLLAHTVVLSGVIGGRIWHEGMKLPAFQMEIAAAVALLMVDRAGAAHVFRSAARPREARGVAGVRPAGDAVRG